MGFFINLILFLIFGILLPFLIVKKQVGNLVSEPVLSSAKEKSNKEHGPIRRSVLLGKNADLIKEPGNGIKTVYDILLHGVKNFPKSKHLFGTRKTRNVVKEKKTVVSGKNADGTPNQIEKEWTFLELGPYEWLTYQDVFSMVTNLASGLRSVGVEPKEKVTIFHSTSPEWLITSFACYSQDITITTAYDSLGIEALAYSVGESEAGTLVTMGSLIQVVDGIRENSKCDGLKRVVYSGKVEPDLLAKIIEKNKGLSFYSFDELIDRGKTTPFPPTPPSPSSLACIMYTSGSTGNPKGVMITHASIVSGCSAANVLLNSSKELLAGDTCYLGYLPLAHVLEFLVENWCVLRGIAIGYGSPRTLTDASVRNCRGDIRELRPTLMAGVPAVWETIRKGIIEKISKASPIQKLVFWTAFELKKALLMWGLPSSFLDKTVFKKIADGTGGRLRAAVSGGAPVAAQTQEFLTVTLCPILQGYGMTECCGMMTLQTMGGIGVYSNVGAPSPACEIKLVATNNYNPNPLAHDPTPPRGELWVRGPIVMSGYYKQPETTKENITEDGWLMSGDIAEWAHDGTIKIIDRKKNLVKLAHGEYVALEKLESQYKVSSLVLNMCVHADPLKSKIIGVVVPSPAAVASHGSEELHLKLRNEFLELAAKANFKGAEILKDFVIVSDEWTPENGMLTAAQKIKRKDIVAKYMKEIDLLY